MPPESDARPLSFLAAARSDPGRVRENNEDSAYAAGDVLILADGMGGHSSGEVASTVAVHTFADSSLTPPGGFHAAAARSRELLRAMSQADPALETMGTTIVAVGEYDGQFYACHIGDSRMYTLRDGQFTQVTIDHTHVQHLVETGRITREQVATHPYRAMLLKSLDDQPGGSSPDLIPLDLRAGDRVLLCSDGLSDYAPEQAVIEALSLPDREEAADALVDLALREGTRDNVTVIVADIAAGEPAPVQFVGAASDPLALSPEAARALTVADPGLSERMSRVTAGDGEAHGASRPLEPSPRTPADSDAAEAAGRDRRFPLAGVLAGGAVVALAIAIGLLL